MRRLVVMAESSDIYHDYRVQKEARSLSQDGWSVTVFGFRAWRRPKSNLDLGFVLQTLPVVPRTKRHLRNASIIFASLLINLRLLAVRADVYHAHNTMFLFGMWLSARLHGGRFVYDAHEVQWEHGRTLAWLERRFIRRADVLINVNRGRAAEVARRFGLDLERITIISNYPVVPMSEPPREYRPPSGRIRLVYSGGFDLASNRLDQLLHAMVEKPDFEFHLIAFGYRDSEQRLRALAADLGLSDRVVFHPLVRPDQVMDAVAEYDVAVNMLTNPKNHLSIRHNSVNKMYEYMAAGMPTLCSDLDSFVAEFVDTGAAISVDATSAESISRGLDVLMARRGELAAMSARAQDLARTRYNWATQEGALRELYTSIVGG